MFGTTFTAHANTEVTAYCVEVNARWGVIWRGSKHTCSLCEVYMVSSSGQSVVCVT